MSLKFASKINSLCLNELTNCPIAISVTITVNRHLQHWPNIRPDLRTRLVISEILIAALPYIYLYM